MSVTTQSISTCVSAEYGSASVAVTPEHQARQSGSWTAVLLSLSVQPTVCCTLSAACSTMGESARSNASNRVKSDDENRDHERSMDLN